MKYTTAILSGLMAATAVAQPHLRHQHDRREKRDIAWVTEIEMVTETVDYTTTVWVSAGQLPAPSTSAPSVTPTTLATIPKSSAAASTSIPESTAAASTSIPKYTAAASSSTRTVLNQKPSSSSSSFVAPSSSTFVSVAAPSTTHTSAVAIPTTSSVAPVVIPTTSSVAPVVPTTSSVAPVVIPTTSSVAPVVIPTTSSVAPVVIPTTSSVAPVVIPTTSSVAPVVIPTTSSAAPVVIPSSTVAAPIPAITYASSSSSSGSSGVCGSGTPCSGDITFYEAGLGACGITTDGSSFAGVALPVGLMGSLSNNNPYCGKTITIKCTSTGKTTQATVIDKCMGCLGNSIDLTNFAFDQLAEESVGRTQATWHFNE
ncbi:hypothetical protein OCU04_013058 [Sclerotinia nivalis]|uniref:RlpA-like protein double-psi beta-barrel domain-containing protein n=1 Tax=Sclerotinia nivalis TaxID=352851 RepID=A0A9X0A7W3_9HELO|nr:hypothetical protein OCU04_013058 [Sclerotinia nivalis]